MRLINYRYKNNFSFYNGAFSWSGNRLSKARGVKLGTCRVNTHLSQVISGAILMILDKLFF